MSGPQRLDSSGERTGCRTEILTNKVTLDVQCNLELPGRRLLTSCEWAGPQVEISDDCTARYEVAQTIWRNLWLWLSLQHAL